MIKLTRDDFKKIAMDVCFKEVPGLDNKMSQLMHQMVGMSMMLDLEKALFGNDKTK